MRLLLKNRAPMLAAALCLAALAPAQGYACACGCGVFEVGTSAMLPTQPGGMAWVEYDFMNQNRNWRGDSRAPAADNGDKNITSSFYSVGAQYMVNRDWGARLSLPFTDRHFVSVDEDTNTLGRYDHSSVGDMRVQGIYSGFSPDMSSGVTFGLKLPTGDSSQTGFDRDTAIGSGSTDMLLGAYRMGNLAGMWNWFGSGEWDQPVLTRNRYRPGTEADAVAGVYYNGLSIGGVKIAPVAQVIGSYRLHDRGANADPANSGYRRVLLSPGIEADMGSFRVYGDVEFPVYQHVRGDQLTAPELFKVNISRRF